MRNGQALQITLAGGKMVIIEGFFSVDGIAENKLFISANGQLAEVDLVAGDGDLLFGPLLGCLAGLSPLGVGAAAAGAVAAVTLVGGRWPDRSGAVG